jgi:sec-independent protein translocase protein TatA
MNMAGMIIGIMGLGGPELIVVAIILLLLFGGKKIPQLMKGIGQGINEFKKAKEDITTETKEFIKKEEHAD